MWQGIRKLTRGYAAFLVRDWIWWVAPLIVVAGLLVLAALLSKGGNSGPSVYPTY